MKNIYYLEDDWRYAKGVINELTKCAKDSRLDWVVRRIPTESDFISTVDSIKKGVLPKPDAFILDVMVRYASPSRTDDLADKSLPPYDRAGLRCVELIRKAFPGCPMVLFSVLDEEDLPSEIFVSEVSFVAKAADVSPLFKQMSKMLS
jgi:hypothetical protein